MLEAIKMDTYNKTILLFVLSFFTLQNLHAQDIYSGEKTKVEREISSEFPFTSQFLVLGADTIHYVESGEGDPVLLLHGLPASSYVWRNIIPNIDSNKKVIALDLLGFGKSSFPSDQDVSVEVQYKMLTDFIQAKQLEDVTFFVQDIGSIVGMLYVKRVPQNVKGIALFEAPFMPADVFYDQLPISFKAFMKLTRTKKGNEAWMVKRNFAGKKLAVNFFSGRKLPKEAYAYYTSPWDNVERRYAITNGPDPAELSFSKGKEESEFAVLLDSISSGMRSTDLPILYLYSNPGLINQKKAIEYAMANFKNATYVYLGKGKHFLTESHPRRMSEAFNEWFEKL
jgi:haloalkane dehalogenase